MLFMIVLTCMMLCASYVFSTSTFQTMENLALASWPLAALAIFCLLLMFNFALNVDWLSLITSDPSLRNSVYSLVQTAMVSLLATVLLWTLSHIWKPVTDLAFVALLIILTWFIVSVMLIKCAANQLALWR
jgi:hypothetical protein